MAWFKVDDSLWAHPKWITLSAQAKALWVTAASWSAKYETFGEVSAEFLKSFAGVANPKKSAKELVNSGLWEVVGDGYRFHEWDTYNISKTALESQKAATRDRVKRHRDKAKNTECNGVTSTVSNTVGNTVSNGVTSEPEPDIDTPNGVSHPLTPSQGAPSVQPLAPLAETEPEPDQKPAPEPAPATSSTPDCRSGFEAFWDATATTATKPKPEKPTKPPEKQATAPNGSPNKPPATTSEPTPHTPRPSTENTPQHGSTTPAGTTSSHPNTASSLAANKPPQQPCRLPSPNNTPPPPAHHHGHSPQAARCRSDEHPRPLPRPSRQAWHQPHTARHHCRNGSRFAESRQPRLDVLQSWHGA